MNEERTILTTIWGNINRCGLISKISQPKIILDSVFRRLEICNFSVNLDISKCYYYPTFSYGNRKRRNCNQLYNHECCALAYMQ